GVVAEGCEVREFNKVRRAVCDFAQLVRKPEEFDPGDPPRSILRIGEQSETGGGNKYCAIGRTYNPDRRRRRIDYIDGLAALRAVAARIYRRPRPRRIKRVAAMTDDVRHRAHYHNRQIGPAIVAGSRRIEVPRSAKLDALVGVAAINH